MAPLTKQSGKQLPITCRVVVKLQNALLKRVKVGTRVEDDPVLAPFAGRIKIDGFEPTLVLFSNNKFAAGDSYSVVEGRFVHILIQLWSSIPDPIARVTASVVAAGASEPPISFGFSI